jgi:very-long-chain (3R)-3-hydroxyacyl-CoA dehydratase
VNPVVELHEKKLSFSGEGYGARGQNQYLFHIDFFDEVDPADSFYKVIDRDIEFVLKKKESKTWPRLLEAQSKPAWLKVDFEKMMDDSEDENDANNGLNEEDVVDWRRTPNLMRNLNHKFKRDKDFGRSRKQSIKPEEFRKIYLFLYNLFQCVGFSYLLLVLGIRYFVPDSGTDISDSYVVISKTMKFLHLLKLLEVLHPLLGYTTHGDVLYPLIEIGYHMFLLFVVIDGEPQMHSRPVTFNIFLIWSLTEVIRSVWNCI